jgi:hypothetical protein
MPLTLDAAKGATDKQFKDAYAEDYGTAQQKAVHLHRIMYTFCNANETIDTIQYPVLNLSTLQTGGYAKLVLFLLSAFTEAGIRPDTPFHNNDEGKYPAAAADPYRYMEYNTIGGGMRLVFDCTRGAIFLSAHYSDPVVIRANGGTAQAGDVDTLITQLRFTKMIMQGHSDGTTYADINKPGQSDKERENKCKKYAAWAKRSPAFKAWLHNKNAAQDKVTVQDWYNEMI